VGVVPVWDRRPGARVRAEHWTGDDGMTAFGWVHAKTSYRCMD
jgi:hypothetical protein